jgi:hypothetical protein
MYPGRASTLTYLTLTTAAQIASDGTATLTLAPDTGQFWAPSVIRVSTRQTPQNTPNISSSYCSLRLGPETAIDATSYLDDTYLGSGDSSSVISGTVVIRGTAIIAQWTNAAPGDTAVLEVFGRTSDTLPELQEVLSPIPGARFSGNNGNLMTWDINQFSVAASTAVGSAALRLNSSTAFHMEVESVSYTLTTSAVVGSRAAGVQMTFTDGGPFVPYWTAFNTAFGQPASTVFNYSFSSGINPFALGGTGPSTINRIGGSLPSRPFLPANTFTGKSFRLEPLVLTSDSGDRISAYTVIYKQYNTLARVGFSE